MTYKFTNRAKKAIEIANDLAIELGHNYIGTEHILYGLSKEGSGVAAKVLENQEVEPQKILDKIDELIGREDKTEETLGFTPRTKRVIEKHKYHHKIYHQQYLGCFHILKCIIVYRCDHSVTAHKKSPR